MKSIAIYHWRRKDFEICDSEMSLCFPHNLCEGVDIHEQDARLVLMISDSVRCEINGFPAFEMAELMLPCAVATNEHVFRVFGTDDLSVPLIMNEESAQKNARLQKIYEKYKITQKLDAEETAAQSEKGFYLGANSLAKKLLTQHKKTLIPGLVLCLLIGVILGLPLSVLSGHDTFNVGAEIAAAPEPEELPDEPLKEPSETISSSITPLAAGKPTSSDLPDPAMIKAQKSEKGKKKNSTVTKNGTGVLIPDKILEKWKMRHANAVLIIGYDPASARALLEVLLSEIHASHALYKVVQNDLKRLK